MAHQVLWTDTVLRNFIDKAKLNPDEIYIMESRIAGATVTQQALHLHKSESSVHNMIKKLKVKYDAVQLEYPDMFPKRKFSAKETYMDSH